MRLSNKVIAVLTALSLSGQVYAGKMYREGVIEKFQWHQATTDEQLYSMCSTGLGTSAAPMSKLHVAGCFWKTSDGVCHVATHAPGAEHHSPDAVARVLGHEYKHCIDGYFHDDVQRIDPDYFKS